MKKLLLILSLLITVNVYAKSTTREYQIDNSQVKVWKTTILPGKSQVLKMHRHDNNRILIALDSGTLEIINDKNQKHYLNLESGKSYFLTKDVPNELHEDINTGDKPIHVFVIELK